MALETIVAGIIKEFSKKFSLKHTEESKLFEYLINYLAVTRYHEDAFSDNSDFDNLDVDFKGQFGLDGIAFIINGNLVTSKEDVSLYAKSKYLDIKILFIQAKTSKKLDTGDFLKTIQATKNFILNFDSINDKNDNIQNCKEIYDEIFDFSNYKYCNDKSPECYIIYAIDTDNFGDPSLVNSLIKDNKNELKMY